MDMSKQVTLFLPTPERITPIQAIVLIQLLDGSKYGYEILRNLREAFHGAWEPKTGTPAGGVPPYTYIWDDPGAQTTAWEPKTGTIYPTLQAIEKKGFVSKKVKDEKTHYSLTKQGKEKLREMSEYVADYLMFNYRFIESTVDNMPPTFTQEVFTKIHLAGIDEILPEATILEAIRELPDKDLKRAFLEMRKMILQRKLKLVRKHLKELEN